MMRKAVNRRQIVSKESRRNKDQRAMDRCSLRCSYRIGLTKNWKIEKMRCLSAIRFIFRPSFLSSPSSPMFFVPFVIRLLNLSCLCPSSPSSLA